MRSRQVQEAEARFSDLLRSAARSGPQQMTVRGRAPAVVLSTGEYEGRCGHKESFVAFLRDPPLAVIDLSFTRDQSAAREIELRVMLSTGLRSRLSVWGDQ